MINKYQQGGKQDPVMKFVQDIALTLQTDPNQIIQIAQQDPEILKAAVEVYKQTLDIGKAAQAFQLAYQSKTKAAKRGAKLEYIRSLKHQCPEGEELVYYKQGGSVSCGCVKKGLSGTEMPKNNPVKKFKERNQQPPKELTYDLKTGKMRAATREEIELRKKNRQDAAKGKGEGTPQRKKGGNIEKDCGGSAVARFKAKCGAKVKKHELGGSLKSIPFYQGGTTKGGIEKSDNTRVARVINNGEGIPQRTPLNLMDFLPVVGTLRAANRIDHNEPNASYGDLIMSAAADILGAKMVGSVIKAAGKANKVHKALKTNGFFKMTDNGTQWYKVGSKPATVTKSGYVYSDPAVYTKVVPEVDYTPAVMAPLVETLRVPATAPFKK